MISVALVKPPQLRSIARGGGYYYSHLAAALEKFVSVSLVEFSFAPWAYQNFDLVHFSYFDEYFFTLPPFLPKKSVVSILDCTKLKFKDHFPVGLRGKLAWPWQKWLATQARAIITISNSAKRDIKTFFAIPADKVFVTYLSADPAFKPIKNPVNKYHLPEKFVLYVGGVNWNKNVPTLIRACQKISIPLVLVGGEFLGEKVDLSHAENQSLKEILALTRNDPDVRRLGFVLAADLVAIYNLATVYVQPSIYEGFGIPVLEAMSCGRPVICGHNGSLPEIAGNAATYADVSSVRDLSDKITNIKKTGKEIAQAKKFSWEKTARQTYDKYQKVLAGN